jgi:phosphoserine phosphatase RsbU/P
MTAAPAITMQCLEVWGGNQAVDNGVVMPGLDAWVFSRPYHDQSAGGDIHYVSSCATGRIARLLVADVSGHGNAAAETALKLRELMRRYINYIDQSKLVQGLNAEFARLAQAGTFATAVAVTYWTPTDEITITNAGHPRPFVYRARAGGWQAVSDRASEAASGREESPRNLPLGVLEPTGYDISKLRLSAGDLLMLYTDSLIEARASGGRQLGEAGLLSLLQELDAAEPRAMTGALLARIEKDYAPPADDVTVLLIRPNMLKPRATLLAGIRSAARTARATMVSLVRGRAAPMPEASATNILGPFFERFNRTRP